MPTTLSLHRILPGKPRELEWEDDASSTDQAAFDLELEEWLATLDERRQIVEEQFVSGHNATDGAKLRASPGRRSITSARN